MDNNRRYEDRYGSSRSSGSRYGSGYGGSSGGYGSYGSRGSGYDSRYGERRDYGERYGERRTAGSDRYDARRTSENQRRTTGGGRKPQKQKSILSNPLIYILMVCSISAILAALSWTIADDVLALNKEELTAVISIKDENDFDHVLDQLKESGVIQYKSMFRLFCAFTGGKDKISAGTYELNTDMDYRAIISNLGSSSTSRMTTSVTIPEGYTVDQIFALLEEKGVSTKPKLQDMAANHNYAFSFLQEIPLGDYHRLEGYLFPDTYEFYFGEDPRFVLNKMLVNFDAKVTDALREQIWGAGYSIHQMVTMASMIEKETDSTDRSLVSSVIYNRLNNPRGGTQGYLQIDATIQYVLPEGQTVTEADYSGVDSPYNTYLNKGLPPGPISNPGLESIWAAMHPESTRYFYYALGDDGMHHYFNTYSEFQNFLAR